MCCRFRIRAEGEDDAQVESLIAKGGVVCRDNSRDITAKSDRLSYDREDGWLVFSSDAMTTVVQEGNKMEAPVIKVNVESGTVIVDGQGRVEIRLKDL